MSAEDPVPFEVLGRFRIAKARVRVALFGSAVLCAISIVRLPWSVDILRQPSTPFDRSKARFMAPGYSLLVEAASVIPPGSSVIVQCQPANALLFWRFAVALLPNRRILPDRLWLTDNVLELRQQAEYLVLWGPLPASSLGDLLLKKPPGSVWRLAVPQ